MVNEIKKRKAIRETHCLAQEMQCFGLFYFEGTSSIFKGDKAIPIERRKMSFGELLSRVVQFYNYEDLDNNFFGEREVGKEKEIICEEGGMEWNVERGVEER